MYEMIIEYDRYENKQRWVKIVPRDQWEQLRFNGFTCFEQYVEVRQYNAPQDAEAGCAAYIFGNFEDYTYNWYISYGNTRQIKHLSTLWMWAKINGYSLKFIDSSGLFEDVTEQPVFKCPTCGRWHVVSEFCYLESIGTLLCLDCKDNIKTCERCGNTYNTPTCPYCYTEEPCCICGSSDNTFIRGCNHENIPVCEKHKDITLVQEASYNWKPASYTFRHMGKERGNK